MPCLAEAILPLLTLRDAPAELRHAARLWTVNTPKGTPKPIVEKLEAVFNKITLDSETKEFLANTGADTFPGNSKLAKELIVTGTKQWGDHVKLAKIENLS